MRKLLLVGLVIVGLGYGAKAQQDYQLTHFMFDRLSINPGVAGITGNYCGTLIARQQWSGFEGAPQTGLFNASMPISSINSGAGLTVYYDKLGQQTTTAARGSFSYHLRNVGTGKLGIGASVGYMSKSFGADWRSVDPYITDDAIPNAGVSGGMLDFSFGLYYHNVNGLYAGLSTTHLNEGSVDDIFQGVDPSNLSAKDVDFSEVQKRHYYLMAGHVFDKGPGKIRPNLLVKSDGAATQVDVNVNYLHNKGFYAGVTYRIEDAIAPMIGYETPMGDGTLRAGYSYDVTTSQLSSYSNGSHEIFVNYCFSIIPPPNIDKFKNPRFL